MVNTRLESGVVVYVANSAGCSGKFHVVFKHFKDLKNRIKNI